MPAKAPHYLLFSESTAVRQGGRRGQSRVGQWRFVLETVDGADRFEAEDEEAETEENRLELLAVVRALESLDQPSHVTVVTPSRYVTHGFRYGLDQWRENDWQWERYGEMTPIRNCDLWQRIDHAMRFHKVACRTWRLDPPEGAHPGHDSLRKPTRRPRSGTQQADSEQAAETNSTSMFGWCSKLFGHAKSEERERQLT